MSAIGSRPQHARTLQNKEGRAGLAPRRHSRGTTRPSSPQRPRAGGSRGLSAGGSNQRLPDFTASSPFLLTAPLVLFFWAFSFFFFWIKKSNLPTRGEKRSVFCRKSCQNAFRKGAGNTNRDFPAGVTCHVMTAASQAGSRRGTVLALGAHPHFSFPRCLAQPCPGPCFCQDFLRTVRLRESTRNV